MATYHLHKWSVIDCSKSDPYTAPELLRKQLAGVRDNEEKQVITSYIVKAEGRTITTYSGSVYILEEIAPEYLVWLRDNNINYDPENPVKVHNLDEKKP